jgi:hypothetical protein
MRKLILAIVTMAGLVAVAVPLAHACKQWTCRQTISGRTVCDCTWP